MTKVFFEPKRVELVELETFLAQLTKKKHNISGKT